ncbi:hypothetical protein NESM_000081100 [Novymonas esmeraldas]|uniref:Uncharacterized protein n=1 Tax=Novymonas esmeraldas TaxID=1808958 RepID=A0AAW0F542_9TRYP
MESSTTSARRGRSPAVPVPASERAKQMHAARLLGRSNELLHAGRVFSAWAAATRERKLQTHLKRCSTMLKHNSLRHSYARCFLRWLAFTQARTSDEVRSVTQLRRDVPLRSKSDFLALARRYFAKWRAHLRERRQRTVTNVELLEQLNRERLRSRTLMRWWRLHHTRTSARHAAEVAERESAIQELQRELERAAQESRHLREQLESAAQRQSRLQTDLDLSRDDFDGSEQLRQTEVHELRTAMRRAVERLEGPASLHLRALRKWGVALPSSATGSAADAATPPPAPETPLTSSRQSQDTAEALLSTVDDAVASLISLARLEVPPASLDECVNHLRERLSEEAKEASAVRAQRDELAAAAQTTRATLAAASPLLGLGSPTDSDGEGSRETSQTPSRTGGTSGTSALRSARRTAGGARRTGAPAAFVVGSSSFAAPATSGATTPSFSPLASPPETTLAAMHELPRLLVDEAKAVVGAVQAAHKDVRRAAGEVDDLQDAALRAIDALGGRGATNTDFMAKPRESVEARVARSGSIADSLRNLCEDMVVVLVLTSLWSGKGASERVSEALERLWHRTHDLEATHTDYLRQLEQYMAVVHAAAALLRPPPPAATPSSSASSQRTAALLARRRHSAPPDDTAATPEQVDEARRSAEQLAAKGDRRPTELLDRCLKAQEEQQQPKPSPPKSVDVPADELETLVKAAQDIVAVTVRRGRSGERGSPAAAAAAAAATTPRRSRSAAEAPGTASPATKTAAAALQEAIAAATDTLKRADGVVDASLVDALERSWERGRRLAEEHAHLKEERAKAATQAADRQRRGEAELRELQGRVQTLTAAEQQREEAKRRLQAELETARAAAAAAQTAASEAVRSRQQEELETAVAAAKDAEEARRQLAAALKEAETQHKASERALKKQLDDAERSRGAAEREAQRQLRVAQREASQSAQDCKKLEKELKAKEAEAAADAEARHAQAAARDREHDEHIAATRALQERLSAAEAAHAAAAEECAALRTRLAALEAAKQQALAQSAQLQQQLTATESETSRTGEVQAGLRQQLADLAQQVAEREAVVADLEDRLRLADSAAVAATAAQREQAEQLLAVERENRSNNAVGVFLRDVVRDCMTRLHLLTRHATAAAMSPRASLKLQQALDRPPPLLTRDSDPSEYVEYVLRLDGNDSVGRRLVQEHLSDNAAVHGLRAPSEQPRASGAATAAAPSTWEVVAELHDRLVLLYENEALMDESAATQQDRLAALTRERDQLAAATTAALAELAPWSSPAVAAADGASEVLAGGHALRTAAEEVAQALADMHKVAELARPLVELRSSGSPPRRASVSTGQRAPDSDAAATERRLTLVADVQDMADCLQHLSESVMHGILALGGTPRDAELNGAKAPVHPRDATVAAASAVPPTGCVDTRVLGTRLEAICRETGASVQEVKELLGIADTTAAADGATVADSQRGGGGGRPGKLSDVLPTIRAKMTELHVVKRESERMLTGLNRAFNDDEDECLSASTSSMQRSLKPKHKPLPAFQGTPEAGLRLLQQEIKGRRKKESRRPSDFAGVLQDTKATVRERIGDLQELRLACRATLQVLEGRFVAGGAAEQPPTYGEALVAVLTAQVEDLRQVLPETEEALAGIRGSLQDVTVGTRLHMLCDAVRSLKMERDSLKDDLARRTRQSNVLLGDLTTEATALRAEMARHLEEHEQLLDEKERVEDEVDTHKRSAAELAAKLAPLQHECNVLCDALVHTLRGLPGTPYRDIPAGGVQKNLVAALKAEQGRPLTAYVEAALRSADAHQHCLQDILRGSLGELRGDVAALRAQVTDSWELYGRPMADAAAQQLVETTEVLALENNMLRPRAIERERLRRDKAELEAELAEAKAARADTVARLEHAEDENAKLRRAARDAQMARVLATGDDGEGEEKKGRSSGRVYSTPSADWERRMIDGATELTMDAVDSMSGVSMSAVFGSVVEETLRIYSGVRHGLHAVEAAYAASRGHGERHVQVEVEERLQELRELSTSADYLWTRLPVLYRVPYQ